MGLVYKTVSKYLSNLLYNVHGKARTWDVWKWSKWNFREKNIIPKRQNKFDRIKSRLDIAKEEKIATELEDIVTEGIQKNLNRSPVS